MTERMHVCQSSPIIFNKNLLRPRRMTALITAIVRTVVRREKSTVFTGVCLSTGGTPVTGPRSLPGGIAVSGPRSFLGDPGQDWGTLPARTGYSLARTGDPPPHPPNRGQLGHAASVMPLAVSRRTVLFFSVVILKCYWLLVCFLK